MSFYVEVRDASTQTEDLPAIKEPNNPLEQGFESTENTKEVQMRIENLKLLKIKEIKKTNIKETENLNKLRALQERLKNELKDINDLLMQTKQKADQTKENKIDPQREAEFIRKQIQNVKDQIQIYTKENERMQSITQNKLSEEKCLQMEVEQQALDIEVKQLKKQTRTLQLEIKDIERKLENTKADEAKAKKINILSDEVSALKKKLAGYQNAQKQNEKNILKQQEFIFVMQNKYNQVCDQFKIQPTLNFDEYLENRIEEEQDRKKQIKDSTKIKNLSSLDISYISHHSKHKVSFTVPPKNKNIVSKVKQEWEFKEEVFLGFEVDQDNMEKLWEKFLSLKHIQQTQQKTQEKALGSIRAQIDSLDKEKQVLLKKLKEKDSQLDQVRYQLQDNSMKSQSLPLLKVPPTLRQLEKQKIIRVELKMASKLKTTEAYKFDDYYKLEGHFKINSISFLFEKDRITGLLTEYIIKDQKNRTVVLDHLPNGKPTGTVVTADYLFQPSEFISGLFGIFSSKIEFLKFTTSRGFGFDVGDPSNFKQQGAKSIQYEIKRNEKPIAFSGIFDVIEENGEKQFCLTQFALILKNKQQDHYLSKSQIEERRKF